VLSKDARYSLTVMPAMIATRIADQQMSYDRLEVITHRSVLREQSADEWSE
jgi:hypothetical protein